MSSNDHRTIYVTATSGSTLSICGYCRKVTNNVTAIISTPFYEVVGAEYACVPEMLSIPFKPADKCMCVEDVLKGVTVQRLERHDGTDHWQDVAHIAAKIEQYLGDSVIPEDKAALDSALNTQKEA